MRKHSRIVAALLAAIALTAAGCGDDSTETAGPSTTTNDSASVSSADPVDGNSPENDEGAAADDSTTTTTTTTSTPVEAGALIELDVVGGELAGGTRREAVDLGDEVTVRVSGDTSGEVHIHGYDLFIDLVDGSGEIAFAADIPGVFEVELEQTGALLIQLQVS